MFLYIIFMMIKSSVIYKITCKNPSIHFFHVGSSTNIPKIRYFHKTNSIKGKDTLLYKTINENGGWDNWDLTVLEKCDSIAHTDVEKKENAWHQQLLLHQTPPITPPKSTITPPKSRDIHQNMGVFTNQCGYCDKVFSRSDSLARHQSSRCKMRLCIVSTLGSSELSETNTGNRRRGRGGGQITSNVIHNTVITNIHNVTNSVNHTVDNSVSNNVNNNINNSINDNSVNNTLHAASHSTQIVPLGKEDLVNFFTNEQQIYILNKMFGSFIYLIEYVHVSGKYPQFQNISITNLRSNVGYSYDDKKRTFLAKSQTDLIASVIDIRLDDIRDFLENVKHSLEEKVIEKITRLISEVEEQQEKYWDRVKHTIYNGRNCIDIRKQSKQDLLNANPMVRLSAQMVDRVTVTSPAAVASTESSE